MPAPKGWIVQQVGKWFRDQVLTWHDCSWFVSFSPISSCSNHRQGLAYTFGPGTRIPSYGSTLAMEPLQLVRLLFQSFWFDEYHLVNWRQVWWQLRIEGQILWESIVKQSNWKEWKKLVHWYSLIVPLHKSYINREEMESSKWKSSTQFVQKTKKQNIFDKVQLRGNNR